MTKSASKDQSICYRLLHHMVVDSFEIGRFFAELYGTIQMMELAEQGRLYNEETGQSVVRCIKVERLSDPEFYRATFRFYGSVVVMAFANVKSKGYQQFCHVSCISFGDQTIPASAFRTLCYPLTNWKPRNPEFWSNMALVFEATNQKA